MKLLGLIKNNKVTILMISFFFIGLMVLLYPSISNYINTKVQSNAISNYEQLLSNSDVDYNAYFEQYDKYNRKLAKIEKPLISYKKLGKIPQFKDLDNTNMIGHIYIEKIRIDLPIYYGTSESVLSAASGLLEGTSFPTGQKGNHSVISAHRGLPSSLLFTNLNKLEVDDTFVIKVLDRALTYKVDQILIVKPNEISSLEIDPDEDYVTLMTCTPYGINSHRLLVRGHRVEGAEVKKYVSTAAFKIDKLIVTPIAFIPMLVIWLSLIAFKPIKSNRKIYEKYVYPKQKR